MKTGKIHEQINEYLNVGDHLENVSGMYFGKKARKLVLSALVGVAIVGGAIALRGVNPQADRKLMQNITYGEAANQSRLGREIITRMILNRERKPEYPSNIKDVIYDGLAFSCIEDKKNENWKQAIGELPRNEYEEMIYNRCEKDVNAILGGKRLGIPFEDEIVAYHDTSISHEFLKAKERKIQEKWKKKGKKYDGYWLHLEPVIQEDDLIFYKEK